MIIITSSYSKKLSLFLFWKEIISEISINICQTFPLHAFSSAGFFSEFFQQHEFSFYDAEHKTITPNAGVIFNLFFSARWSILKALLSEMFISILPVIPLELVHSHHENKTQVESLFTLVGVKKRKWFRFGNGRKMNKVFFLWEGMRKVVAWGKVKLEHVQKERETCQNSIRVTKTFSFIFALC